MKFPKTYFRAYDAAGAAHMWAYWRDTRRPVRWMLEDPAGYVRTLESTWVDSQPYIRAILENYGMTAGEKIR